MVIFHVGFCLEVIIEVICPNFLWMWIIFSHKKNTIQLVDVFLTKHPPFFSIENWPNQKCHVDIMLTYFFIHHQTKCRPSKFWLKFKVEQIVRVPSPSPFLLSQFFLSHSRFCTFWRAPKFFDRFKCEFEVETLEG